MTHNPDGSITLTQAERRGIDALIAAADRHAREAGVYTSQEMTEFVRKWRRK